MSYYAVYLIGTNWTKVLEAGFGLTLECGRKRSPFSTVILYLECWWQRKKVWPVRAEETENIVRFSPVALLYLALQYIEQVADFSIAVWQSCQRGFLCIANAMKRQSCFPWMSQDDQDLDLFSHYECWPQSSEQGIYSANTEPLKNLLWLCDMKQINYSCKAESWSDKLGYCAEISASSLNLQVFPRLKNRRVSGSLEECLFSLNLILDSAVARTLSQNKYIKFGVSFILELWPWFEKYLVVQWMKYWVTESESCNTEPLEVFSVPGEKVREKQLSSALSF